MSIQLLLYRIRIKSKYFVSIQYSQQILVVGDIDVMDFQLNWYKSAVTGASEGSEQLLECCLLPLINSSLVWWEGVEGRG